MKNLFKVFTVLFASSFLLVLSSYANNNSFCKDMKNQIFASTPIDSILKALIAEDSLAKISGDKDRMGMAKAKLGNYYYNKSPQTSIDYNKAAADLFMKAKNKPWTALSYQNVAFAYEEGLSNYREALKYVEKALPIWREIKDTMGEANILKYQGLLYGKIHEFSKAKVAINQAIIKFRSKNFEQGVGVCYYDLSQVYFEMGNIDSCMAYLFKAKTIYKKNKESARIFLLNNKLMGIYINNDDYLTAKDIFDENEKIAATSDIYGEHLLEFYSISEITLKRTNFLDKASAYEKKYSDLKQKLEQQGIKIKTE
jgi:tetratricopeptide (TPR) repeat protein